MRGRERSYLPWQIVSHDVLCSSEEKPGKREMKCEDTSGLRAIEDDWGQENIKMEGGRGVQGH